LTNAQVRALKEPGRYGDGGGLWLQISKWRLKESGEYAKSWILRYWIDSKERNLGLGPYPLIGLADAREMASKARRELRINGTDPIDARKQARVARRLEKAKDVTFGKCATDYIAVHRESWKSDKHVDQWLALEKQCKAIWTLPVQAIDTELVLRVLTPLWKTKTITATRVRARIEAVLGYAAGRGLRPSGDNPARWRGHLESMLAAPAKIAKVVHHKAIPVDGVPAFMAELRSRDTIAARCLEITTLTALRSGEVTGARWDEVDVDAKVWTIPAERMKAGREHRIPLSDRAVAIFKSIHPLVGSDLVFEGVKRGDNPGSMLALMREIGGRATVHGLRSSFRDWAGEKTNFPRDLVEEALAHSVGDKTERAYRRSDLLEKRRRLMDQWSAYCASTPSIGGKVIEMRVGQ
jgi:integrase